MSELGPGVGQLGGAGGRGGGGVPAEVLPQVSWPQDLPARRALLYLLLFPRAALRPALVHLIYLPQVLQRTGNTPMSLNTEFIYFFSRNLN